MHKVYLILIASLLCLITPYDKDLWGVVISTSHSYENYRHSVNSLMMYNFLKKNGIPDERLIVALSEFHACDPRNFYPGKVYLTEESQIKASCNNDISIDYKNGDFYNYQMLDILRGRYSNLSNHFRKLNTNSNSRIIIIISAHGGENFIKVRERSVILSEELNRTLNEMHIKGRYKEILFILDTCEGFTLFDAVTAPNIYFVTSSLLDQKALSHSFDKNLMLPTADKFHFKLHEYLERIYKKKEYKYKIHNLFQSLQKEKAFIITDVGIRNEISREIIFEEFFGNPHNDNHKNYKYQLDLNKSMRSNIDLSNRLNELNAGYNDELLNTRGHQVVIHIHKGVTMEKTFPILLPIVFLFIIINVIINLRK